MNAKTKGTTTKTRGIALLAAALLALTPLAAQQGVKTATYRGTVGQLPISLTLETREDGLSAGELRYEKAKYPRPFLVLGQVEKDGFLRLAECQPSGKVTGYLAFNPGAGVCAKELKGTWHAPDGKKALPIALQREKNPEDGLGAHLAQADENQLEGEYLLAEPNAKKEEDKLTLKRDAQGRLSVLCKDWREDVVAASGNVVAAKGHGWDVELFPRFAVLRRRNGTGGDKAAFYVRDLVSPGRAEAFFLACRDSVVAQWLASTDSIGLPQEYAICDFDGDGMGEMLLRSRNTNLEAEDSFCDTCFPSETYHAEALLGCACGIGTILFNVTTISMWRLNSVSYYLHKNTPRVGTVVECATISGDWGCRSYFVLQGSRREVRVQQIQESVSEETPEEFFFDDKEVPREKGMAFVKSLTPAVDIMEEMNIEWKKFVMP